LNALQTRNPAKTRHVYSSNVSLLRSNHWLGLLLLSRAGGAWRGDSWQPPSGFPAEAVLTKVLRDQ
jgi:hypothetical protein